MIPIQLTLYAPLVNGNGQQSDVTNLFGPTWRRTIRSKGGFWLGTVDIDTTQAGSAYLSDLFTYGILSEIREGGSGQETWRGLLVKMDYTLNGMQYVMDINPVANMIRSIYTRIFDNLVPNGDCESGAWGTYGTPTSVLQYTAWKTGGNYSMQIISPGGINGATVAAAVTIAAGVTYSIKGNLRVVSGSWRFSVNRTDTGAAIAHDSTHGNYGDHAINISIPNSNTYAGTVNILITSEGIAGEIWADDISLAEQSRSANTGWQSDINARVALGRKEDILLESGMSDAAANARVASQVRERSWPQTSSPAQYQTRIDDKPGVDKLSLTFAGYWATLNWTYTRILGTSGVSTHITNILARLAADQSSYESMGTPFVQTGYIEANTLSYTIDNSTPLRCGDVLRDMASAGETGGAARYGIGVVEDRRLNYARIAPTPQYTLRHNRAIYPGGGEVEPWLVRPGWVINEDMPLGAYASQYAEQNPRWEFIEEVEMKSDGTLSFNKEAL
jgi:hypothetical protein